MANPAAVFVASCLFVLSYASVLDFTDDFDSKVTSVPVALVKFYAPWCGHCQALAPDYKKASDLVDETKFVFAEVDCTKTNGKRACETHGVSGYPTLKLFRNGSPAGDYDGERSLRSLVDYANRMSKSLTTELETVRMYESFLNDDDRDMPSLVGFFSTKSESDLLQPFNELSKTLSSSVKFGFTFNQDVMSHANVQPESLILYRAANLRSPKLEPESVPFTTPQSSVPSVGSIERFIKDNKHGHCGLRTRNNADEFALPLAVLFTAVDMQYNRKAFQYTHNRMVKIAKEVPGLHFAISDIKEFEYVLSSQYGIDKTTEQTTYHHLVIINEAGEKFVAPKSVFENVKSFPSGAVIEFLNSYLGGSLKPYLKSEPVPKSPKGNDGVTVLVGTNAKHHLVDQTSKDVLIEFYAPWCGHCKSLAPVYQKVAEHYESDDGITIAKIDATANDFPPSFDVRGFPTIFFVRADQKDSPIRFEAKRDFDSLVKFVNEHRSTTEKSKKEEL
ncbi:hypothetical protein ACOME3_009348 [Neoechinorhynchus agilis]